MSEPKYEHHLSLKQDKLCPFRFKSSKNLHDSVCNWHTNIEILLVTHGEGNMQYNSDELAISQDDIIVINSGDLHRIYSDKGISFNYLIIDESFCRENGINTAERRFERLFKCAETRSIFGRAYERYTEYKGSPTAINTAKARLAVLELLIAMHENHSAANTGEMAAQRSPLDYVKQVIEFLAEHYNESLTLEEVAGVCGITKFHLAREFKRYTGQTVITYVNILRCRKAEICLSEGMTVTEAAVASGFDSISYFSRTYKKLMGVTPSEKKHK